MIRKIIQMSRPLLLIAMLLFNVASALAQDHSLNSAIRDGDLKQVKTLLAQGANLNAQDADGTTRVDVCRRQCRSRLREAPACSGSRSEPQ